MRTDEASPVSFRPAADGDAAGIAALLTDLGYATDPGDVPARIARFTAHGAGTVLIAEAAGRVAALAALEYTQPIHHSRPVAHVSAFVVGSAHRRRGLGRRLLTEVERLAAAAGCPRIVVTSAEHRADAHAFYVRAGWNYNGRRFARELTR